MKFTVTYTRTLTLEETIEAASLQEAEAIARQRAWASCELTNADFDESETAFEVLPPADWTAMCEDCGASIEEGRTLCDRCATCQMDCDGCGNPYIRANLTKYESPDGIDLLCEDCLPEDDQEAVEEERIEAKYATHQTIADDDELLAPTTDTEF